MMGLLIAFFNVWENQDQLLGSWYVVFAEVKCPILGASIQHKLHCAFFFPSLLTNTGMRVVYISPLAEATRSPVFMLDEFLLVKL